MLGVAQKLTKLDIALETSVAWDSGSGSQKMAMKGLLFTLCLLFTAELLDCAAESAQKFIKNARNRRKLAET